MLKIYESCTINLLMHAVLIAVSTFAWGTGVMFM